MEGEKLGGGESHRSGRKICNLEGSGAGSNQVIKAEQEEWRAGSSVYVGWYCSPCESTCVPLLSVVCIYLYNYAIE